MEGWRAGSGDWADGKGASYYDEVGLLVPAERTPAGHRLYGERLYRVLALRRLGLPLDEIAALLDDDRVGLVDTVRRDLQQVDRQLEQQHRLRDRLRELLDTLEQSIEPSAEQFIDTSEEAMTVIEASVKDVLVWQAHLEDPLEDKPLPRPPRTGQRAVLLEENGGARVMPIWIGIPRARRSRSRSPVGARSVRLART